ncbi:protein Mis18-beta [Syngnathus scovelli]|uniref:protein Mis18-beta n=1 Tax=Syngnathus scovelli TaxID=161590 RepID=UPI00210FBE96|nr:protein Mis18-beta [Syngnathus scovelli]
MEFNETILLEREDSGVKLFGPGRWATFHCKQCNTVLGDSLSVCGELTCLGFILCCRVTSCVEVGREMECGHKGELANCIFSSLTCSECGCTVGKVVHAAPPSLAGVRSLFLLQKGLIKCYVLDSRSMVKASAVSFEMKSLMESVKEVRQQLEMHFEDTKSRLLDVTASSASLTSDATV